MRLRGIVEPLQSRCDPFRPKTDNKLPKREQDDRNNERHEIIEHTEQQHSGQQLFPVELEQTHQHRGVEHTEAAGRVAGKAEQRRGDEDHRHNDEPDMGFIRDQNVHRQRAEAEIHNADDDLQQCQRAAGKGHGPASAADFARLYPDPGDIGHEAGENADCGGAVEPDRKLVDGGSCLRMIGDAETEHGGVAEPEGQTGEKADLCDIDSRQAPGGIDAIAHHAAGEDAGADIVSDRIAGESGEGSDPVRHLVAADGAQRKQVIERQGEITRGHTEPGEHDGANLGFAQRLIQVVDVETLEHVIQDVTSGRDDRDTDRDTKLVQDLLLAHVRDGPAQCLQHPNLKIRTSPLVWWFASPHHFYSAFLCGLANQNHTRIIIF